MKRLILSTAIILGGLTAVTAQNTLSTAKDAETISVSDAVQDYKEVKESEVPQVVKDRISEAFDDATISKAYVNAQGEYKIQLATADQKSATVYTDAKGQLIKNALKKQ